MTPEIERVRTVPGWVEAVIIGIVSRLIALAALWVAWAYRIPTPIGLHWTSPVIIWDAQWYLWIVNHGYHAGAVGHTGFGTGYYDFAFFPLYPSLIAIFSLGGVLPVDIVAPVLSNVLFVLALVPIRIGLERLFDRKIARFGLLLFAFSPAAYAYSLAYSEPLFLLLAGGFLLTTEPVKGFVLGALAGITRLSFGGLAAASLGDLIDPKTRRLAVASLAGIVLAFAAWWAWIANLTHNFWGYMLGTPSWYSNDSPTGSPTGLASILRFQHPSVVFTLVVAVVVGLGTIWLLRRKEYRLGLYSAACFTMAWLDTWNTMPRLMAVAFPAFAAFAALLPSDRWRWLAVAISVPSMCVVGALAVASYVVP